MKILYPILIATSLLLIQSNSVAQQELVFQSPTLQSGTAGADGAVYKFPAVNSTKDALVTIAGRSSALVTLSSIDLTSTGFSKSFQPQIAYNGGTVTGSQSWWMEFVITFVDINTPNPSIIDSFNVTGLDIDGDGSTLKEYDAFYSPAAYVLENSSVLTVTNLIVNSQNVGKTFTAPLTQYMGIDSTQTTVMTTQTYKNVNTIKVRLGASTVGNASDANRMYSLWFKSFNYTSPKKALPVKLVSFDATLNNKSKVDLKWTTATEENVSHFVVERSVDGVNYTDAGLVFAMGNSTQKVNYTLADDISNMKATVFYYRLCTVDVDEKYSYSEVRIIRVSNQVNNTATIITYPNPVSNELRITVPENWQNKKVAIELLNVNGQLMKRSDSPSSSQTETINVTDLNRGFYIVRVSCNGETAQQKIIKN